MAGSGSDVTTSALWCKVLITPNLCSSGFVKSEKSHAIKDLKVCNYSRWATDKVAKCLNKKKTIKRNNLRLRKKPKVT